MTNRYKPPVFVIALLLFAGLCSNSFGERAWPCHTIDQSSVGADGVRLADVDQDGRTDVATGWEEGGQVRVCFQPSKSEIRNPWPSKIVGKVASPEDATFADVNRDGWLDLYVCNFYYEAGDYNNLWLNNGDGTFTDVTLTTAASEGIIPTFDAVFIDYNKDGWPDLYTSN
ncbi:MAG: VCBS repeat-containing protein, partial [Planctomycetota bacterium]